MKRLNFLIILLLVLVCAAALTAANSTVRINYCKGVIKSGGSLAVLKEDSVSAAVIKLGGDGSITGRVNILLNDPFTLSVKSVHDLFSDDEGNLYFFCTVYGLKRAKYPQYDAILKCNFTLGSAAEIWSSKTLSGCTAASGGVPYVDGSSIYIPMTNTSSGTVDIMKFTKNGGYSVVVGDCCDPDSDTVIYRDGMVFSAKDTAGVFVNGENIIGDPSGIYDALSYDNGILSFVDIAENKFFRYDVSSKALSEEPLDPIFAYSRNKLQKLHAYSDGTVTASREDGENLRAYRYRDGKEEIYSFLNGGFFLRAYLIFTVLSAAAAALIWLLYRLFFVRIRRQNGSARKYQSIAARITAISTAAGVICGIAFGILVSGTVEKINSGLQNSIDTNGSQFLAGYIFTECVIETENGIPALEEESSKDLAGTMADYRTALYENNGIECDFLLFVESNGRLYMPGKSFDDTITAEYEVSLRSVELIQNSIETGVNCAFEDKMTSGILKYTCTNFPIYSTGGTEYNGVLCTVTDVYRARQSAFVLQLWLIVVIFLLVVLLLIAANVVLHCSLSGLKRLRGAFDSFEENGEPSVFLLSREDESADEISETGHALMLMTEGSKVHTREISEGNRKYKRFMAAGILRMLNRSEISKVNFGDRETENALILRFIMPERSDITEYAEMINAFLEKTDGILLNFSCGKADVCFTNEEEFANIAHTAARTGYPLPILASYGKVEAGSAGSDVRAWLIALSGEFSEFDKLGRSVKDRAAFICTEKAAEKLQTDEFLSRCEMRPVNGCFEIIPIKLGEENELKTSDNNSYSGNIAVSGSLDPVH